MKSLACAVVGRPLSHSFLVELGDCMTVEQLKIEIKNRSLSLIECDANRLTLFMAKKDNQWLWFYDPAAKQLEEGLTTGIDKVPLEVPSQSIQDELKKNQMPNLKAEQIHVLAVLPGQNTALNRLHPKTKLAQLKHTLTPSMFANCNGDRGWVSWMNEYKDQIDCHRFERSDGVTPIPLVLLNEAFSRFQVNCTQVDYGERDCDFAMKLCHEMSAPYAREIELQNKSLRLLKEYLLADLPEATIVPVAANNATTDGSYLFEDTLLLNMEFKLQKGRGGGGGDPTMQNVGYYIISSTSQTKLAVNFHTC